MPEITGILETALYVENLDRATNFYQSLFGFNVLMRDDRLCALSVADTNVLLLFKQHASCTPSPVPGGTIPPHDGQGGVHIAFAIRKSSIPEWEDALEKHSIVVESRVFPERGGQSLYFRDPDRHLVELVTPGVWPIF